MNITGTYTPTSGTLTTGGFLTLKSTASGTARVAAGATGGGYILSLIHISRKDGELLYAFTQDIPFDVDAMHTRVLIANDITRQMLYIEAIEKQNEKLNRISFAQSHKVRSPLASIMGLTNLLNETTINTEDYSTILSKLTEACTKLDNVIREIDSDARPQAV